MMIFHKPVPDERVCYKLDDSVIAHIVRVLQVGLLTGTDITDHMRMFVLEPSTVHAGSLVLTPEYIEKDANDVEKLLEEAAAIQSRENEKH